MRELSDDECFKLLVLENVLNVVTAEDVLVSVRVGYAAGYRAAQEEQSAATPSESPQDSRSSGTTGPPSAVTDDPAADHQTADLCARLRTSDGWYAVPLMLGAADALERLARENAKWNELHRVVAGELDCDEETWPDHRNAPLAIGAMFILIKQRAERAEAEPQEGDLLHTMMEWARTEEGRKQLADSYRPHLWACAKRVADPQNEAATCRHWCGDIEHCQPIASAPAQAEPQPEHAGPIAWLRTLNGDPDWQEDCVHAYEDDARRNLNAYIDGAGEGEVYSIIPLYAASPAQAEPQPDPTPNLGPFSSSLGVAAPDVAALVEPQAEAIPIAPVEVVRQALKELLESISECRMDQVTARFAKASVMARAVVDRYKDAT